MKLTTNYSDIWDSELFSRTPLEEIRALLRNRSLDLLSLKNKFYREKEYLKKPRIQFLYIHHVFEDELEKFDTLLKVSDRDGDRVDQDAVSASASRSTGRSAIGQCSAAEIKPMATLSHHTTS